MVKTVKTFGALYPFKYGPNCVKAMAEDRAIFSCLSLANQLSWGGCQNIWWVIDIITDNEFSEISRGCQNIWIVEGGLPLIPFIAILWMIYADLTLSINFCNIVHIMTITITITLLTMPEYLIQRRTPPCNSASLIMWQMCQYAEFLIIWILKFVLHLIPLLYRVTQKKCIIRILTTNLF